MHLPKSTTLGRLNDLQSHPDALRIAYKPGKNVFDELTLKIYPSRASLETFLKQPGEWKALVKNPVSPQMLIYPAFQTRIH